MNFKCNCNIATKLAGDGCQKCNTEYALDLYPQPAEICHTLESCEIGGASGRERV